MDARMNRRTFTTGAIALAATEDRADRRFWTGLADRVDQYLEDEHATEQYPATIPAFIRETMGFQMWPVQDEIAGAVETERAVAVRSCHAAGKSAISARIVPAFLHTRPRSIGVTTAPTNRQVQHVLWRYINTAVKGSRRPLLGRPLQTRYEIADDWYALGFKGGDENSDAFQGFHAENILVIADEAAGVAESVFDGMDSILTGTGSRLLLIGNPTSTEGTFRAAFHEHQASYYTVKISAYDTPNFMHFGISREDMLSGAWREKVGGATMPYPALIDPQWVADQFDRHGPDSDYCKSRIDAEFPEDSAHTLIPLSWIDRADQMSGGLYNPESQWYAGIDVARSGDDETCIALRHGMEAGPCEAWRGMDTMESAARADRWLRDHGMSPERITEVRVDVVGVGAGVADRLREMGWPVRDVNVGSASSDREKWQNLRHELWWQFRERFREERIAPMEEGRWSGYTGTLDDIARAQLSSVRYRYASSYTMPIIESKDEAKKRKVASPDRGEAYLMAFGDYPQGVAGAFHFSKAKGIW